MNKKKLLIVNSNLHIGGVQRALVALLWNIRENYDITLLLFYKGGECLKELPDDICVIEAGSAFRYLGMHSSDAKSFRDKLGRAFFASISRILGRKYAIKLMGLGQKKLEGYDYAVSYLHNSADKAFYGGCNDFVLNHVKAGKKISFLHGDYQLCGANTKTNAEQYARFDAIATCSKGCADSLLAVLPQLREKLYVVKNCQRYERIKTLAEEALPELEPDKINVVTVARLGREKSVGRAVEAISKLGALREKLRYYIIGDGIEKAYICSIIDGAKLHDVVTLCGSMEAPYAYIKSADLLLIPSRSEAAPLIIGEAACLGTPILSTATSSAKEMLTDTGFGWVCENSVEGIREKLQYLIENPALLKERKEYLKTSKIDNKEATEQFTAMLEML